MTEYGERKSKAARQRVRAMTSARKPWFELEGAAAAKAVFQRVNSLREGALSTYRSNVVRRMRLYAGSMNINGVSYDSPECKTRYNLIRSVVGAGAATLGAARTLPYGQTRGASWKLRRKVAKFNRGLQQQFASNGVFNVSQQVILDALIGGLGVAKVFADPTKPGGMVGIERCLPLSVIWDPAEAATAGGLTQLWEIRLVNRDALASLYPDHAEEIIRAQSPSQLDITDFAIKFGGAKSNQCVVIESWKLPSSDTSGDGVHTISVSHGELLRHEWKSPRFPLPMLRGWEPAQLGLVGTSLTELMEPFQLRLEELQQYTDDSQDLGSHPFVITYKNSGVRAADIDNLPMRVLEANSPAVTPIFQTFDATPHDLENSFDRLREQALSEVGLSQTQVQGETQDGVTSAVGQRTREQIASKRHVMNIRWVEQYYLDVAWAHVDANNALADDPDVGGFQVDMPARGDWLESMGWKEVRPDESEARLAVLPMAALMGEPAAFYQQLAEWEQQGKISPQTSKLLESLPDVEGQALEDTADQLYAEWLCDKIEDGERVYVEEYADPLQVLPIMKSAYLNARIGKADEEVLSEYRRQLDKLKAQVEAMQAQMMAAQAPSVPNGPAPALPGAAPAAALA